MTIYLDFVAAYYQQLQVMNVNTGKCAVYKHINI